MAIIETTLGEYGHRMPIGIYEDGELHKGFEFKRWTTAEESRASRKIPADTNMTEYVGRLIAHFCSRIGPYVTSKMSFEETESLLGKMYMADVYYIYCCLRIHSMGKSLKLNIECDKPRCGVSFPFYGDLNTVQVRAVEDVSDTIWTYDVQDPFDYIGKPVNKVYLQSPKWGIVQQERKSVHAMVSVLNMVCHSVFAINEPDNMHKVLADGWDMGRIDLLTLSESIDENWFGMKMTVEGQCDTSVCTTYQCGGHKFKRPIDWRYSDFFGLSSR